MLGKKLIVVMMAAFIGMATYGGSSFAHDGHGHDGATGHVGSVKEANKGELCPVSGEEIEQQVKYTYEHKGKVYNLCCAGCLEEFKKDPEKYVRKMNGATAKNAQEPAEHEGHD